MRIYKRGNGDNCWLNSATAGVLDKAKEKVGEEVWNAMLAGYKENPRVGERDFATFGYSVCVAGAPAATK